LDFITGFHSGHLIVIGMWFGVGLLNTSQSDHRGWSCDVIYIFQDVVHSVANQLPISSLVMQLVNRLWSLCLYPISKWSVNFRLRYNYFWFLKSNGRHIGFLFSVPILTISSCVGLPDFIEIGLSASEIWRHRHFSMAAVRRVVGNNRPPTSVVVGLNLHFTFRVNRTCSFGVIAIFLCFGV